MINILKIILPLKRNLKMIDRLSKKMGLQTITMLTQQINKCYPHPPVGMTPQSKCCPYPLVGTQLYVPLPGHPITGNQLSRNQKLQINRSRNHWNLQILYKQLKNKLKTKKQHTRKQKNKKMIMNKKTIQIKANKKLINKMKLYTKKI